MKNFIVLLLIAVICTGCISGEHYRKKFMSDFLVDLNKHDNSLVFEETEPKRAVNVGLLYVEF